jgi:hypothetical protein
LSETKNQNPTASTGHWGQNTNEVGKAEYGPLGQMVSYPEIKAQAGRKVSLDGILYIKQPLREGHLMGVISSEDSSRPVFIQTTTEMPIPLEAPVYVRGRIADEPWANAA